MPSPIAHLAAGYIVYRLSRAHEPPPQLKPVGRVPGLLIAAAGFSLLPDVDSIVGFLASDFGRYHNNLTHSFFVGGAVSLVFAGVMKGWRGAFTFWFLFMLACYSLHVLMDSATWSRGVMAFWPFSERRFLFPITIFHGLHWSQGWLSSRHWWTVSTELIFAGALILIERGWARRTQTGP